MTRPIFDPRSWDKLRQPQGSPVGKEEPVIWHATPAPQTEEEKKKALERM